MNQFKNYPPQYLLSNPTKANGQQSQIIALSSAQQLTIGRSHENSLQILDNTISKKHSKIVYLKGNYYVYDLQSANGVLLNGEKIQNQCKLEDGDCLQFGKYPILYKFMDNTSKSKSRGKGKINLKDYLFQDNATQPNKQKNNSTGKDIFQGQQSVITQPITQSRIPTQPAFKNKKVRPKQSKIKIPDLSDYLKLTNVDNEQSEKQIKRNDKQSPQQRYTRSRMSKNGYGPKQGKIKLQSLQQEIPNGQQLKQYKLQKRERNIYIQQQQALQNLERQRRKIEQQKLKKQLQQAKLGQDLLQKQLLLQQKVRQQQQKVQKQKQKLQQQFIKRQQIKREQELLRIKNMEQKQKQMMAKIQQQRNRQIQQLKNKQKIIKQQSQNQYKKQYERRKKQLQTQAQALARQYQNIYRETIKKVRTQIDNQQSTINKMQSKQQQLTSQSQSLTDNIKILEQQLNKTRKQFLQISGRNKACILYASELQDKIDALGRKQFTQNQQGYYKNFTSPGFNTSNKNIASKKVEESILNSRKLLKIKVKQYENILQQIASLSLTLKERQYASSDVSDFVDTIFQNLQIIQKLKQEYLELVQCQRTVQQIWDAEIEQNSELQNKNRVLQSEITKNIRQIDENSRDQIKKSTEQRLHMLKVMHFCPEQKKNAAKFLIQEMLNIQQQIHKFRMTNQDYHNKICKIISKTEKMKRQNEYFSQILFSQDQNGHHFDNMKVVINNLIDKIGQQKNIDNIGDCLQLAKESMKYQLLVQSEIQRKKGLRQNMRKISEMGLAPGQIRITDKNPLTFFGDLLTNKQIQMQKRKNTITSLQNESNNLKNEIKLLEDKKSKISQALQKYKVQQLNQARKYLGKTNGGR